MLKNKMKSQKSDAFEKSKKEKNIKIKKYFKKITKRKIAKG